MASTQLAILVDVLWNRQHMRGFTCGTICHITFGINRWKRAIVVKVTWCSVGMDSDSMIKGINYRLCQGQGGCLLICIALYINCRPFVRIVESIYQGLTDWFIGALLNHDFVSITVYWVYISILMIGRLRTIYLVHWAVFITGNKAQNRRWGPTFQYLF